MFEAFDSEAAQSIARQSDPQALVHELAEAGFVSQECEQAINRDLKPILDLIARGTGTETDWQSFQRLWGFADTAPPRRITPMNAANLCPRATGLVRAINRLREEYNLNVAQQTRTGRGRRVIELEHARSLVALGVGLPIDSADIVIVRNASEGNNLINRGYTKWRETTQIQEKDNVVIWKQNHPTNNEAWKMRAHWNCSAGESPPSPGCRFVLREVEPNFGDGATADSIAKTFTDQICDNTRFVSFSETSNSNGQRIPAEAIRIIWEHVTKEQRFPNCHIHIDGTMTWGARAVNLSSPHCHSFTSSSHKWFLGPKETGILYMAKDKVENFMPSIFAYDYKIDYPNPWTTMPKTALRFQLLGQRDDVNVISLAFSQTIWNHLLRWKPYDRVTDLAETLKQGLMTAQWKLVSPESPNHSSGVVWVEAPQGRRSQSLFDFLYSNPRFKVGAGGGGDRLRLCPHLYNTKNDLAQVIVTMNGWRG